MSDIVEWLRSYALNVSMGVKAQAKETLTWQAADEIERLRAENDHFNTENENAWNEIERLTATLRKIADQEYDEHTAYLVARAALERKP